ncbi:MAG TPA: class I SAM-dependent methyltransferase, partial [Streptosporangiaceae bacterium]|nr:class I SAM-dependent methyltransferase [Streptosporangiaceae bacterium]
MTSPAVFARLAHSPAGPPAPPGQPALPPVPAGPAAGARAHAARALLRRVAARLPIRVEAPDGSISGAGGPGAPALMILREDAFYRRLGAGTAGLAEGYMAGDWIAPDLVGLFTALAVHVAEIVPRPLQVLRRWYIPREPAGEDATIDGARRNIERHYDLSDDLFALFLDPTMTYSSALFAPGDTLADGQRRKIDTLLDRTGTGPGTTVLEIGTGWGELAVRAAARGAQVTTLTISPAQWAAARRRAAQAGLADR